MLEKIIDTLPTEQPDPLSLVPQWNHYRDVLSKLRLSVKQQFDPVTADNIENVQAALTLGYQNLLKMMLAESFRLIGEPPCRYAWIGSGSYSRGEVLPYSDVEYLWLFEGNDLMVRQYFLALDKLIIAQINSLEEPGGFNPDQYPEVSEAQDSSEPLPHGLEAIARGFAIKCKAPQGVYTQIISLLQGKLIAGEETLWTNYFNQLKEISLTDVFRKILFVSVEDYEKTWGKEAGLKDRQDAKKGYSFFITYLVVILKFQFNVEGENTLEILQALIDKGVLPKDLGKKCQDAWKKVQMLRYCMQTFYKEGRHDFYEAPVKTIRPNEKYYYLSTQEKSALNKIYTDVLAPIYRHLSAIKTIEKVARKAVKTDIEINLLIQAVKAQTEAYQALYPALLFPKINKTVEFLQETQNDLKPLFTVLLNLNQKNQAELSLLNRSSELTKPQSYHTQLTLPSIDSLSSQSHIDTLMKLRRDTKSYVDKGRDIKFVQEFLSAGYENITQSMLKEIEIILGPAPGQYCILAFGSLSRRDVSACSDLEPALLVENLDNKALLVWLKSLLLFWQYIMESLGESEGDHAGFHLDKPPYICWRKGEGGEEMLETDGVETIESYLHWLNKGGFTEDNTRLKPLYLYGDSVLFRSLQQAIILPGPGDNLLKKALNQTRKTYQAAIQSHKAQTGHVNVKTDYLQPITLLLTQLSYFYGLPQDSSAYPLDILTELAKADRLDKLFVKQCAQHLEWLYRSRLQTQLNKGVGDTKETDLIKRDPLLNDIEKETLPLLSRLLKWVLEDRHIGHQCHPLYYPSTKGERVGIEREHQAWCDKISQNLLRDTHTSKLPPIKVKIAGIGQGWLNPELTKQLLEGLWVNKKGEFNAKKESSSVKGRHLVMQVTLPDPGSVYLKVYPEMPGMEYAASSLSRLLTGRGLPLVAIARFEVGKEIYPVLISEAINGYHFDEVIKQKRDISFDSRFYSEMMILTLMLNPEDAKPDNFILVATQKDTDENPCMGFVSIDNDRTFYPSVLREEEKNTILVKSIVYCFDEMNLPFNPALREEILSLTPHLLLSYWLDEIARQDEALRQLFNPKEIQGLFKERTLDSLLTRSSVKDVSPKSSIIPIPLREKLISELYLKLCKIQNTLKQNPEITHLALLKNSEPLLGHYYGNLLKSYTTAIQRFQEGPGKMYDKGNKDSYVTQQTLPQTLKTLQGKPLNVKALVERKTYYAKEARIELLETHTIYHSSKSLLEAIIEGKPGTLEQLSKLPDELKENIINELDFNTVNMPNKEMINLIQSISFKRLRLNNFIELKEFQLKKILKNSPELQDLTLRNIPCVDNNVWATLEKNCSLLKNLHLDNLVNLKWDSKGKNRKIMLEDLEELVIVDCVELEKISLYCKNLLTLELRSLSKLRVLDLDESTLKNKVFEECLLLPGGATKKECLLEEAEKKECLLLGEAEKKEIIEDRFWSTNNREATNATPLKFVVVGDDRQFIQPVKTAFLIIFTTGSSAIEPLHRTFGNCSETVCFKNNFYNIGLWHTQDQEEYDRLRPLSYPHSDCFILMFTIINPSSFENIWKWYFEVTHHCPAAKVVLLGIGHDLRNDPEYLERLHAKGQKPITYEQGIELAKEIGAITYIEIGDLFKQSDACVLEVRNAMRIIMACNFLGLEDNYNTSSPSTSLFGNTQNFFPSTKKLPPKYKCLHTLQGHDKNVTCVAVLPYGNIVSGSLDKTLKIWDADTGKCLHTLQGHDENVTCVAVLPNGNIVSGSWDKTLKVWDAGTSKCLHTLRGHSENVMCVAVLPNGNIVSGSRDKTLKIWDTADTGKCLHTLQEYSENAICILPNSNIVSGSWDKTLKVWNAGTGKCLHALQGHSENVMCVAVLPNSNIVSGSRDKTLKVWDINTAQCLHILQGHSECVMSVAVLPNGNIVSGSWDKTLKVWDAGTGTCLHTMQGHSEYVISVAALPNGNIVSGSWDKTLKIWQDKNSLELSREQALVRPTYNK